MTRYWTGGNDGASRDGVPLVGMVANRTKHGVNGANSSGSINKVGHSAMNANDEKYECKEIN